MEKTKIDNLREELIKLRKERSQIILEKGFAAEENKDLRENSAYDYWFEKEMQITSRIYHITNMIQELSKKSKENKKSKKETQKKPKTEERKKTKTSREVFKPHNWL